MRKYWKQMAEERLREYDALCRRAESLTEELKVVPLTGKAGSPARINCIAKRRFLRQQLKVVKARKAQADRGLAALTPQERLVVQMLDIAPARGNGAKLCQLLDCEIASIYRRRDRALKRFSDGVFLS